MRHRDPDVILGAWLDELAQPLPADTKRAIDVGIQLIPQRRRPWWLPWRFDTMTTSVSRTAPRGLVALAAALGAIALVAVGALTLSRPGGQGGVGGPAATAPVRTTTASPSPSAAQSPSLTGWQTFVSERYGFEVQHPPDWTVVPATQSYRIPEPPDVSPMYDKITRDGRVAPGTTAFTGTGMALNGMTADEWFAKYCGPTNAGCLTTELPQVTVDGRPAYLSAAPPESTTEIAIEVFAFVDDRLYILIGWGDLKDDRPLFDAFLSTVRFHPEDAVDPSPSPEPSGN